MKLLDRLVLLDLVPNLLVGIAMFTSLFIALGPLLAASRFLAQGIPFIDIVKFILFNTTSMLGQTFPMGMLLAVLLGYGRLSSDSETVALFAGGIPFLRIVAPAAVLGLLVSLAGYVINDPIASYADRQILDMRQNVLGQKLETDKPFDIPSTRDKKTDKLLATVHIDGGFNLRARWARQVYITLYSADGAPSTVFYAQSAHPEGDQLDKPEWELDNVVVYALQTGAISRFPKLMTHDLPAAPLQQSALRESPNVLATLLLLKADPNVLPFQELRRALALMRRSGYRDDPDVLTADVALWNKIALPLAAVIFALVGAPLALRPQRTSKVTGWILSLPIILTYYVLYTIMGSVARGGACSPVLAAFLPDIVGLLVGIGLVWKRSVT